MGFIGLILFLAAAAIILLPIVALVTARTSARELREAVAGLNGRIRDLESQVARLARERSTAAEPAPVKEAADCFGIFLAQAAQFAFGLKPIIRDSNKFVIHS
jgi:hypothetical protein